MQNWDAKLEFFLLIISPYANFPLKKIEKISSDGLPGFLRKDLPKLVQKQTNQIENCRWYTGYMCLLYPYVIAAVIRGLVSKAL